MGRQASAQAALTRRDSDLQELSDPASEHEQALLARPRPAFTPPVLGPRPPGRRYADAEGSCYASAALDPQPAAAARARRLTRECLARWGMPALTDDAEAIASELAANAVAAVPAGSTGLSVIYALHAEPAGLRIYTWDIGPGHPRATPPDADAETGRGLAIIDALTSRNWGWWPTPSGGKVVWAALTGPDAHDTPSVNPAIPERTTS